MKDLSKERNELAHENALLELKLNKNISNGVIDEEGEAAPPTKFERDSIEAAAGAKARTEADTVWEGKVSKIKEEHAAEVINLKTEMARIKLGLEMEKEGRVNEASKTLSSLEMQSEHVKEASQVVGDLKTKLLVVEQERDAVRRR